MPTSNPTRRLLNEQKAAAYLDLRPATLRQSRWSGLLGGVKAPKHLKLGRNVRYELEALDAWIEEASK